MNAPRMRPERQAADIAVEATIISLGHECSNQYASNTKNEIRDRPQESRFPYYFRGRKSNGMSKICGGYLKPSSLSF